MLAIITALKLVVFHGPDGHLIEINPDEVVSLREPREMERHFHKEIRCLIFTSDGKFTGVTEDCIEVAMRLRAKDAE